jgi:hypothetical protein
MAIAPASGGISSAQQAALAQIRALRAVRPPTAVTAPAAPVAAPVQARSAGNPIATLTQNAGTPPANRPRGSIINIQV